MTVPEDRRPPSRPVAGFAAVFFGFFVVACAALVAHNASALRRDVVPHGDLAADMLLEQRLHAGAGGLWVGHYSRFGFNHPGPFFLWCRALGSVLPGAASLRGPYNRELAAVLLVNCAFVGLAAAGMWRFFGQNRGGAAAAAAMVAAFWVHVDWWPSPLSDVWVPSQLVAPFLAFSVFAVSAARGDAAALAASGLIGSLLVHGNLALPIFIVPLWIMAAIRAVRVRGAHALRGPLLFTVGAGLLSGLPAIVDLVQHWPGNIGRILTSIREHPPRPVHTAWAGPLWRAYAAVPVVAWVSAGGCLIWLIVERSPAPRARTIAEMSFAATLLSGVYAMVTPGFPYEYLWFFFAPVPLMLALAAPLELVARIRSWWPVAIVAALGAALIMSADHGSPYRGAPTARTFASRIARATPAGTRVGIIWDRERDWPIATAVVLALQGQRRSVCAVTPLWFLFTPEYVCGDTDQAYRLRPEGQCASEGAGGLCLDPVQPLHVGDSVSPKGRLPSAFVSGWSEAEPWGTWTHGPSASIVIEGVAFDVDVTIVAHALVNARHPQQRVRPTVAGRAALGWTYSLQDPWGSHTIRVPGGLVAPGRLVHLILALPDAVSPQSIGMNNEDTRMLAIGVTDLRVRRASN